MRTVLLSCLGLILTGVSYGQTPKNPQTGMFGRVEIHKEDEAEMIRNSEEMEELFVRRGARYQELEVQRWLSEIGESLAPPPSDPYISYRFYVVRDPSPNAFALPDGQIYVHTGMLARLDNEAQLACLLGHEINHVSGHHGILNHRSVKKKAATGAVFGGIFGVVGAAGGWTGAAGSVAAGITNVSVVASMLGYSRSLESEADVRGFSMVYEKTNYALDQCPALFREMSRDFDGIHPLINAKWSTHPSLSDRAEKMDAMVAALEDYDHSSRQTGHDRYRLMTHDIAVMTVDDYVEARYPATAVALGKEITSEQPEDSRAWAALGRAYVALGPESVHGEDTELERRDKLKRQRDRLRHTRTELRQKLLETEAGQQNYEENLTHAIDAFEKALSLDEALSEAYLGLGDCEFQRKNHKQSAKAYIQYLRLDPDSPERPMVMSRLKQLKQQIKQAQGENNAS